jgi:GNAT superfamily N-acetyltransferase
MTDVLERIGAFEREYVERTSTRSERCRFGTAYFHEGFPRRWDSNFVWVTEPLAGVDAKELAADADDLLGRAGLAHRSLWVEDPVQGERLAPGLARLGYRVDRNVVMVHAREPDRWTDDRAEEIDVRTARDLSERAGLESPDVLERDAAVMLAGFRHVLAERVGARFFGAREGGEFVAGCELVVLGDVANIEDVFTLRAHRGRGLARAVVLAAVRAAREAGADLVYLGADDEDWPKLLYAKLGFDAVGRTFDFVRRPDRQRA